MIFPVVVWLAIGPYQFDYVAMSVNRTDKELSCKLLKPIRIEGTECSDVRVAAVMPMENGQRIDSTKIRMSCHQEVQSIVVDLSCS